MQPHKIRLKPDYVPKISYPYRIAQDFKVKIQKQIDQYLKDGILQESESDWGSPAIVLQKGTKRSHKHMPVDKNPKLRLVIDYRYLNSQTIYSKIEMPRLDNLIDMVASQKPQWFSSLDIKDGYWQMTLGTTKYKSNKFSVQQQIILIQETPTRFEFCSFSLSTPYQSCHIAI